MLFCFVDKKIFQNILAVGWCERFFADLAMNQAVMTFRARAQACSVMCIGDTRGRQHQSCERPFATAPNLRTDRTLP